VKKSTFSLGIAILMIAILVGTALAEGAALPGTGWWTGETIQNVGGSSATVYVTAYDAASSSTFETSKSINSGASETFIPTDFAGMSADFEGSAIVSSAADIRAIVNVTNRISGTLGDPLTPSYAAAQYQGMLSPDTTIRFPLFKNNQFNKSTTFYIQNAGSASATATVTFVVDTTGIAYPHTTPSIGPGQMVVVSPLNAGVPDNTKGGVSVTSTQPLAGVVLEHFTAEAHATVLQATRSLSASDYDNKLFAPTWKKNRLGRFTGMNIQNVEPVNSVNVTVTYYGLRGDPITCVGVVFTDTKNGLEAGKAWTFSIASATISPPMPDNCAAAAVIQATGNIVGQVNESYTAAYLATHPGQQQESTVYYAIPENAATTVVSIPIYKEGTGNKYTGINVQNTSLTTDANVTLTFTNKSGTVYQTNPYTIAAGNSQSFQNLRLPPGATGTTVPAETWNGTEMTLAALGCASATAACPGTTSVFGVIINSDVPIVAMANEATWPLTNPPFAQDKNNYEGFNLLAAP